VHREPLQTFLFLTQRRAIDSGASIFICRLIQAKSRHCWLLSTAAFGCSHDDDYRIGPALAENLVQDGIAVALIRYRLAPVHRHPAQVEDVAAAVAQLVKDAAKHGFDARRIYLAGHSAGGHLASLVGLDSRYLARHGVAKNSIAGIVSISGLYDLNPDWRVSKNQVSPLRILLAKMLRYLSRPRRFHHVRADAPPFLIIPHFETFPASLLTRVASPTPCARPAPKMCSS
jgi:hypothetical protein